MAVQGKCPVLRQGLMAPQALADGESLHYSCLFVIWSQGLETGYTRTVVTSWQSNCINNLPAYWGKIFKNKGYNLIVLKYLLHNLRGLNINKLTVFVEVWWHHTGNYDVGGKQSSFFSLLLQATAQSWQHHQAAVTCVFPSGQLI